MAKKKNISELKPGKFTGKDDQAKSSVSKNKTVKKQKNKEVSQTPDLEEPNSSYSVSSRIRRIGNSKGVILPNRIIERAGISPDADIVIHVSDGLILIEEAMPHSSVNTDLSSWDAHFKHAIKTGNKPEKDLWEGLKNRFDVEEWS